MQVLVTFFMKEMFENNCLLKESLFLLNMYILYPRVIFSSLWVEAR